MNAFQRLNSTIGGEPTEGVVVQLKASVPDSARARARLLELFQIVATKPELEWCAHFPDWFLASFARENDRPDTVDGWLWKAWVLSVTESRVWTWWGSSEVGGEICLEVVVQDHPYSVAALQHVLKAIGGRNIRVIER